MIFVFSPRLSLCPQGSRGPPALTVCSRGWEVGGPEGPDGGGSLPARGQHLHLQTVEGGRPQTWHREHRAILRGDRRGRPRQAPLDHRATQWTLSFSARFLPPARPRSPCKHGCGCFDTPVWSVERLSLFARVLPCRAASALRAQLLAAGDTCRVKMGRGQSLRSPLGPHFVFLNLRLSHGLKNS